METYNILIANVPESITERQMHDMFAGWGDVKSIEPFADAQGAGKVYLTLETEHTLPDIMEALNGYSLDERRLTVTPRDPEELQPRLSKEQKAFSKQIATVLGETEPMPCYKIKDIVRHFGIKFAQVILEETLAIEEAGGLMLPDGSRRRTPGGVFFHLVRQNLSPSVIKVIFPQRKKSEKRRRSSEPESAAQTPEHVETPESTPPDPLIEKQARLAALRQSYQAAQQDLEALQTGQKQGGLLTTMKQVVDLQRQIDALLAQYPELG